MLTHAEPPPRAAGFVISTSERITRRSQVQILPPLLERPWKRGLSCFLLSEWPRGIWHYTKRKGVWPNIVATAIAAAPELQARVDASLAENAE
jgi:hypothetical protein